MSFTHDATDVFDPVDGGGNARGASMSETRTWGSEMQAYVEALLTDVVTLETFFSGAFTLSGIVSPPQVTSNQNDYNPAGLSGASLLSITTDASRSITGLQGGANGRHMYIYNVGAQNIVLEHQDAGSSAANRFVNATGADITLTPGQIIHYVYFSSRWRHPV